MATRAEMIQQAEAAASTTEQVVAEKTLRPTINFPAELTIWSPSFYAASGDKKAQVSGWSHELQLFVRVFGELAEKIEAAHNPETGEALFHFARHNGEVTGTKGKPITLVMRHNANGLLFEPTEEYPNGFASANEQAIARVKPGTPDTMIG